MKRLFSIILIVLVSLGLVACANSSRDKTIGENTAIEESNKDTEEASKNEIQEDMTYKEKRTNLQGNISESSGKQVLVVYFSVTGNTRTIAEKIAALTDADLYEIKPAIEYTDADIDYGDSNSRTSKEQNDSSVRPNIQSEAISLEGYDTIYIGYPIWWGEEPRIMDTFVENYDFENITMIPFCTSGSSSIGSSGKNLADNADSGNWLEGKRFNSNASESEIKDWISGL